MKTDYYLDQIRDLLDEAARDKSLSTQEYAVLCGEVWSDAQGRCEAAMMEKKDENHLPDSGNMSN